METCCVCDGNCEGTRFAVSVYEDLVDFNSDGARSVCKRCYYLVHAIFQIEGRASFSFHYVKALIRSAPEMEAVNTIVQSYDRILLDARRECDQLRRLSG